MKKSILFAMLAVILAGCGESDDSGNAVKNAGSKVGETLTDFTSGIGKGIDKKMIVVVNLSDALKGKGVSSTAAKSLGLGKEEGISVYLISKTALKSKLIAKALNQENQEIGRSIVEVDFAPDDAKYVKFEFDSAMESQQVKKYLIDIKK